MTRSPALTSSARATAQPVSNSEIVRRARPIVFMLIASFSIDRAENGPAFFHDAAVSIGIRNAGLPRSGAEYRPKRPFARHHRYLIPAYTALPVPGSNNADVTVARSM